MNINKPKFNINDRNLMSKIAFLVIYDLISINIASFFALVLRFDFRVNDNVLYYFGIYKEHSLLIMAFSLIIFSCLHLYTSLWHYASIREMVNIGLASVSYMLLTMAVFVFLEPKETGMPRSFYLLSGGILFIFLFFVRFLYRAYNEFSGSGNKKGKTQNTMIVGAGAAGSGILREIKSNPSLKKKVICFVDDDAGKVGKTMAGIKIAGKTEDIPMLVGRYRISEILIAMPSAPVDERKRVLDICKETGARLKILPGIYQIVRGDVKVSQLKEVDVNDLLGREPIEVDMQNIMDYVHNKVILVTGAGGSIGSELCRQIAEKKPKQLILIDIYENTTYDIQNELKDRFPDLNMVTLIASVRNTKRIDQIFEQYRPEIVYHAAAHKHVPLMEESPNEAVKNNVLGTWKVVLACSKWNVKRFVLISTDKAVNPTSIMGASKRICEMIIQTYNNHSKTEFVAVRFGNVLGSNGSVIPLFKKQIASGGPVTVTHPDIVRFFMTIQEAVSLVLQAGSYAKGGEIFVLDMGKPVKIDDLAKNLILLSGLKPNVDIKIEYVGLRPGEKLYEETLMDEEGLQSTDNKLIHIGKPLQIDEAKFLKDLEALSDYVQSEPDDIRRYVKHIVPTYSPKN